MSTFQEFAEVCTSELNFLLGKRALNIKISPEKKFPKLIMLFTGAPSAKKLLDTFRSATLRRAGGRIVGGEDATYGEFPHQIELQVFGALMCGGSLVADQWVVTAGHCCDG